MSNKRFTVYDIKYTDEEKECIKNFKIIKQNVYEYKGTLIMCKLKSFLENVSETINKKQIIIMKNIIKKITKMFINKYKTKYYFIVIKTSKKNFINSPTWHIDNFTYNETHKAKLVTTLIGPSTLFLKKK